MHSVHQCESVVVYLISAESEDAAVQSHAQAGDDTAGVLVVAQHSLALAAADAALAAP